MAVWSKVLYGRARQEERLDAEYFMPFLLELDRKLGERHSLPLGDLSDISCSAFYPAATELYEYGDTPFLRCVDIIAHPVLTPDQAFAQIPQDFVKDHSSIRCVKGGDIVISKVGSPCFAGLLDESMPICAMTRTILGLRNIQTDLVDPRYLVIFLRSSIGFDQLMRERELTIQYQLTLDRTRKVRVYLPPMEEQRQIGDLLTKHLQADKRSKELYAQAEGLLLSELGLRDLDLSPTLFYNRPFAETQQTTRLDAEFFQPKYYTLIEAIHRTGNGRLLGEIVTHCERGLQPQYDDEGDVAVVNTKHMGTQFLSDDFERCSHEVWAKQKKARLKQYDVLFYSTGAYIGRTNCWLGDEKAIGSNHVTIIRPNGECNPVYLSLLMNSQCGLMQADRRAHGSAQREVYPNDLKAYTVWLPPMKKQESLGQMVLDAKTARDESRRLLEEAKRMVEEAVLGGRR